MTSSNALDSHLTSSGIERFAKAELTKYRLGQLAFVSVDSSSLFTVPPGHFRHVVTVNAEIFVYAHEDLRFGRLLQRTTNTVDGRIVQLLCGISSLRRFPRKLSGSDFIYDLTARCSEDGERLFLLGASERSNKGAVTALRRLAPDAKVYGFSPPMTSNVHDSKWTSEILARIREIRPRYLLVCFGPRRQEFWIDHNRVALMEAGVSFVAGLGGSIDFVSGHVRRAPRVVQQMGMEWLFRFLQMPRSRFGRTLSMFKLPWYALHLPRLGHSNNDGEVG